ncbi:MAG: terminase large subunit, partial [Patescibacteria group bacterium]
MILELDSWQKEVLEYNGDVLLCTGRRVGKTQIMAIKAAERMLKSKCQIVIASLSEDQAKLIILMIVDYLQRTNKKQMKTGNKDTNQSKVTTKNGSTAIARPVGQTGDALRGFNGDVLILDEVSRFNELIMTAATPILLTTGGQIWMCSTPFGKKGYFWEKFDEAFNKKAEDARFKTFYKTSEDVVYNRPISESWTEKQRSKAIELLEKEKKDKSELVYGQEYLGLFMEDLQRFYDDETNKFACVIEEGTQQQEGKNYLGCDLARMGGDKSTFEIVRRIENKYF